MRSELIGLGFFVVIFFGVIGFALSRARKTRLQPNRAALVLPLQLASAAPTTVAVGRTGQVPAVRWEHEGVSLVAYNQMVGKYPHWVVRAPSVQLPKIVFRSERGLDRFGKAVGLNREVQAGNAEFDQEIYLETDVAADVLAPYLRHQPLLNAIRAGAKTLGPVRFGPEGLEVSHPVQKGKANEPFWAEVIARLAAIRRALPEVPARDHTPLPAAGERAVVPLWLGLVAGYFFWVWIPMLRADSFEPIVSTPLNVICLVCWAVLAVASYFWVRGHSRSLRIFFSLNLALPLVILTWVTGLGFGGNAGFDQATPTEREVKVLSKQRTGGKSKSCYVRVESWRPEWKWISIRIPQKTYDAIAVDSRVIVETSPGAFGWEWVPSVRPVTRN